MCGSIAMRKDKADIMHLQLKTHKNILLINVTQIEGTHVL